jgi:simple sugar transport system permease protein
MRKLLYTKEISVMFGLVLLIVIFSILGDSFFSLATFSSIASVSTEMGILALGATLLMIAGEFDLSLGSNFALSGMVFALLTSLSFHPLGALLCALLCGSSIGFINGFITLKTRIPSFITTLGTMLIFRGWF